ncbi:Uncharacterised protein [Kingella potus]|uniref:Lipoprotein n=1 Tax=Kingella potus TaxID=265175 RepID=A0A377R3D1_9NEIS|nr:hypothetical protein [Kingella potus]UOP00683.1 hypothetical protein LVJ84_12910 [Kingella potus]STR02919.1 Uncharacterised protein [Kingella potus]STR03438.1 Uncharacterised protein [Kingella potus]STR03439.1 Uncharacterised protein [Kingella potus]
MRLFPITAALALAACAALPHPHTLPTLPQQAQWFKLEQTDAAGQTVQTSLLAVEQLSDGIRFVQTDALGAPVSRQTVSPRGWQNDGFVMPNAQSRRLFAALLPLLAAERAAALYPDVRQVQPETPSARHQAFCPEDSGALFRYRQRDLWCVAHKGRQFDIRFPDQTRWIASPLEEQLEE